MAISLSAPVTAASSSAAAAPDGIDSIIPQAVINERSFFLISLPHLAVQIGNMDISALYTVTDIIMLTYLYLNVNKKNVHNSFVYQHY